MELEQYQQVEWTHRSGGHYKILRFGVMEHDLAPVVIYARLASDRVDEQVWVRPCSEFFDGRFTISSNPDTNNQ